MNSIDMIPQSYREQLRVRLWGRNFLAAMGVLLLLIGAAKVGLVWTLSVQKPQLEKLQRGRQAVSAQLAQVEALRARKSEAEKNLAVLATLRGGPPVEQLSATIDHAINNGVWFSELQFVRSAEYAAPAPGNADPAASGGNAEARTQPPLNQLEIRGQAHSHSALAQFAKNLAAQPGTRNVRVVNTARRGDSALDVVQFEIAAVVNGAAGGAR
jgi:Tfp pilus assembly protein PilN